MDHASLKFFLDQRLPQHQAALKAVWLGKID